MSASDFVSRGQALVAAGQYQEAVKVCRLGLLGRPTTVEGRVVLGEALLALKRFDEVLAEMRVALELDSTSVPAQVLKGEALLRKGDQAAALETLQKARQAAPGDQRILQLLSQAEQASSSRPSTSHPSVSFVGESATKHYPNHPAGHGDEDSGGNYTQPTSLAAPGALRRSSQRSAAIDPSPQELAVGDRSGTVEVDPELEGVEVKGEEYDDVAAPPRAGKAGKVGGARGSVKASKPASRSTIDLDDDVDDLDIQETRLPAPRRAKLPGPGTAVRNAVGLPSGPIDGPMAPPPARGKPPTSPPRSKPPSAPPPLAAALAQTQLPPARPVKLPSTPEPLPPAPRMPAQLPTVAEGQAALSPASIAAAARPTIAVTAPPLSPAQQQTAAAVDAMFGGASGTPMWAARTIAAQAVDPASLAAANEPTLRPAAIDPAMAALYAGQQGADSPPLGTPAAAQPPMRTGMRKERTKLTIALWIAIGVVVIGGGVFAGFQIRAMRLQKQIAAARDRATDLAKADTWAGWSAARDSLAQIVGASSTVENRAALARARGVLALEFDDGAADAHGAVEDLGGQGGLDGDLAAAYVALAESDAKAAKASSDAALSGANQDPAALYVAGRAALLSGDPKAAVTYLKEAYQHDARPLYGVGLARALAESNAWDDAIGTLDRVLASSQDHPAAVIERARLLAASGRVVPGAAASMELRAQVEKVVAEGAKPMAEQPRGVSPAQVAFANLALARIDHARGDMTTARGDMHAAASIGLDDQRFGEEAIDTLFAIGELGPAKLSAERAIAAWPQSRRARVTLAQVLLATGKPNDALAALDKGDAAALPMGLAVRGQAKLATGDENGARADFEAALKKLPDLEPALVGRAWLELSSGNVDEARKIVEPHVSPNAAVTPAMATIYAAVLRASGDAAAREKAKAMLEKVVSGPPGLEVSRAQLELARLDRDLGDYNGAKAAYQEAAKSGNFDARLESALLMLETRDAAAGHDTLESLLREQGDHVPGSLAIEVVRARMLVGDNAGAQQLLDATAKTGSATKWKLERERGRLALRKGDFAGAVSALSQALETSGSDAETFLLAADAATSDDRSAPVLAVKIKRLVPERLKGLPEASIVTGKLLIADKKYADAVTAFQSAIDALTKAHADLRRQAQAHFGLAVAQYNNGQDAEARNGLQLVMEQDPTLYTAYLYSAYLVQEKQRKTAFDYARRAVELDPDSVDGWLLAGQLASKLGDHKFFADALARLGTIAPASEQYKQLEALRR